MRFTLMLISLDLLLSFIGVDAEGRDCSPDSGGCSDGGDRGQAPSPPPPSVPRTLTPTMDIFSAG